MTSFQTISKFRDRLDGLENFKRGVYKGVREEIKAAFEGASIEQIRNNRDMILMQDDAIVIKLRLPDHRQRLSKANGYRLIYMASLVKERVVFLDVYPKRGPMQQLDIPRDKLMLLLGEYIAEDDAGMLQDF